MVAPRTVDLFLKKHRSIAIDTSAFIYFVEGHPRYFPLCEKLFSAIETGKHRAFTSTLTLLEVLVQPYRLKRDDIVLKFYALLTTYPHLAWVPLDTTVADRAAQLRAEHNLRTPDSIQAASASLSGATGFVCNDRAFEKIKELDCLIIDDYASK